MDPRHDPRVKKAKREAAKQAAVAENGSRLTAKYADLFDRISALTCASVLMDAGDGGCGCDPEKVFTFADAAILAKRHTQKGLGLPALVVDRLEGIMDGRAELGQREDKEWWVMELLRVAVGGVPGGGRGFAWNLIATWDQAKTMSESQLAWAEKLLEEARNTR